LDHTACPFCAANVPAGFARRAIPAAKRRLDRVGVFTFATTLTIAACGGMDDSSIDKDADSGDRGNVQPVYGAPADPPRDAGSRTDTGGGGLDGGHADTGSNDDGGSAVLYGLPPPDAGQYDGNIFPPYGLPPPIDSGSND
jgi:hypothetical protein